MNEFFISMLILTTINIIGYACGVKITQAHINSFDAWKIQHDKSFTATENQLRLNIFVNTLNEINEHNRIFFEGKIAYTQGLNEFSAYTPEEALTLLGLKIPKIESHKNIPVISLKGAVGSANLTTTSTTKSTQKVTTSSTKPTTNKITTTPTTSTSTTIKTTTKIILPDSLDWRNVSGMIQPIRTQGKCGCCWAFASIGTLEAAIFKKTNKTISLSEQQLVDCTYTYLNSAPTDGCGGGWMGDAYYYLKKAPGSDLKSFYPYSNKTLLNGTYSGSCYYASLGKSAIGFTPILGYYRNSPFEQTEQWLKTTVANLGPTAFAWSVYKSFKSYKSGVYYQSNCTMYDTTNPSYLGEHAMILIGYGTDAALGAYWIARNSWGTNWGEKGYVRIARNNTNLCSIWNNVIYPLI